MTRGLLLSHIINFSIINHHASIINMNATTNMQHTDAVTKHQAFQVNNDSMRNMAIPSTSKLISATELS